MYMKLSLENMKSIINVSICARYESFGTLTVGALKLEKMYIRADYPPHPPDASPAKLELGFSWSEG